MWLDLLGCLSWFLFLMWWKGHTLYNIVVDFDDRNLTPSDYTVGARGESHESPWISVENA